VTNSTWNRLYTQHMESTRSAPLVTENAQHFNSQVARPESIRLKPLGITSPHPGDGGQRSRIYSHQKASLFRRDRLKLEAEFREFRVNAMPPIDAKLGPSWGLNNPNRSALVWELNRGVNPNTKIDGENTMMDWACRTGAADIASLALDYGAD
jgi:ankyrin repeat protein